MRLRLLITLSVLLCALIFLAQVSWTTPQFARKYNTSCQTCHVAPPKLNQTGENFLANGYRFASDSGISPTAGKAFPMAVWATGRGTWELSRDRARGLVNRVELISAGPIKKTAAFYFVEWLPVSQEVGSNGQRVERHGRFEDVFVSAPLGPVYLTVGQYRSLSQIDVSRRLSVSEPLAFTTGVAGERARTGRLTSLRSFSLSGRSPAIRLSHHWYRGKQAADGWYNSVTVPFAGEFVIPLTSRVHRERGFEFEFRPKGVFLESYYKHRLSSIGAHAFIGDGRRLIGTVGSYNYRNLFTTLAVGFAHELNDTNDTRVSWETEWVPRRWVALGLRLDDRTGANRPLAVIPHMNFYFPLTRYTFRVTAEHRQQRLNRQWLLEAGIVF